jgi:hypothetical protein
MKKIIFLLPMILFFASCKCKKATTTDVTKTAIMDESKKNSTKTFCLDNGKCTIEIFRNKSLDVKTDDFGSIYYNKIDNPETSVILYKYVKNVPKGLQDGNYSEQIVFEINNSDKTLTLSNQDMQKTKMLFGRFCFCRGQTGNYKVEEGNLNLKQKNNEVQFDLDFKITKVPQLINAISEIVK